MKGRFTPGAIREAIGILYPLAPLVHEVGTVKQAREWDRVAHGQQLGEYGGFTTAQRLTV